MDESALFIFLSNYESQGLVVEEAICAGTPTIVADTSAIREFAECNLAFAFKQNESKKIAKKMIEIINNPQKHAPKISNIKKCYLIKNWKQVCTNTDQIYMKVLGKQ
jgi:glycosyltransferase involved in cell wall biosynthesis